MKCSNPECNLGLVGYRRSWFGNRLCCSRHCRDACVAEIRETRLTQRATTYFEWLFLQPLEYPQLKPIAVRAKAH
jgi:hypothetical protein